MLLVVPQYWSITKLTKPHRDSTSSSAVISSLNLFYWVSLSSMDYTVGGDFKGFTSGHTLRLMWSSTMEITSQSLRSYIKVTLQRRILKSRMYFEVMWTHELLYEVTCFHSWRSGQMRSYWEAILNMIIPTQVHPFDSPKVCCWAFTAGSPEISVP